MPPLGRYRQIAVDDLSPEQATEELLALAKELEYHDHMYYNEEQPALPDAEYDSLSARAASVEKRYVGSPSMLSKALLQSVSLMILTLLVN